MDMTGTLAALPKTFCRKTRWGERRKSICVFSRFGKLQNGSSALRLMLALQLAVPR